MSKNTYILKTLGLLAILFSGITLRGQQNNSLYFIDRLPQSIQLNPALQPSCNVFVGIPGLSSFEINAGNNALGVSDILIYNKEARQLVTPLYSKAITNQTLDKLRKNNIFSSGFQLDLITFGFKIKESYVSFLISDKANISTSIPKDLFRFAYNGIDVGQSYTFDNINVNATYYREYSISYSQRISDKIYFGVRGKALFGKMNLSNRQTDISLNEPNWRRIDISASTKVNMSIPNMEVYTNPTGAVDSIKFNDYEHNSDIVDDLILLKKNRGYGFDIGFQFYPNDKLSLSASILDLGYINWKTNVHNLAGGGDYSFEGINLDDDDSTDVAEALLDTLQQVYDVSASEDAYNTMLTPKVYIGLTYSPNRFIRLGLLSRTEYVAKTFRQQVTGTIALYPTQCFGTIVSYTVADRVYDNLGIGFIFRGGPLQMYFMSDRIPIIWNKVKGDDIPYLPVHLKNVNFRAGINLVFGSNQMRKLRKDQPFLE